MSWANKKVLVTGADGFIASHLTEKLINLKSRVSVIIRGTSINGTNKNTFKNIDKKYISKIKKIISCDISSSDVINHIIKLKPDYIFHLAASAYVPYSFDHPIEVNQSNVMGTLNVLEAARELKNIKNVICTSSSEVYGSALTSSISETHPLNPTSPYAASKVAADRYCFSYIKTYNLPITIIRPFNTYGPRHTYDVVPKFIKLALNNEPITIHGDGNQSRDLTYVSDAVDAFLKVGISKNYTKSGQFWNWEASKNYFFSKTN